MLSQIVISLLAFTAVAAYQEWSVQNAANLSCIIVRAEPTVTLKFVDGNQTYTYDVPINNTRSTSGDCNWNNTSEYQKLSVQFSPEIAEPTTNWILDLVFRKVENGFDLFTYNVIATQVPGWKGMNGTTYFGKAANTTDDVSVHDGKNAFKCSSTPLALVRDSHIDMKNFHALAFAEVSARTFSPEQVYEMCKADAQTSDIVPIIVGACLAGLVVIVLVAYLIGRARARRQGYASV